MWLFGTYINIRLAADAQSVSGFRFSFALLFSVFFCLYLAPKGLALLLPLMRLIVLQTGIYAQTNAAGCVCVSIYVYICALMCLHVFPPLMPLLNATWPL